MRLLIYFFSCIVAVSAILPVSAADIVLGQSVPLTGSNADIGRDMRDGALAVFNRVNDSKVLGEYKIQLITLDNANNRPRALENTKQLIDSDKVVGLFGYNSATNSLDSLSLIERNSMVLFAPFTGSSSVRNHPNVFSIRASYKDEAEKIVSHQKMSGANKAVIIFYDDEAGKANVELVSSVFPAENKPRAIGVKRNAKIEATVFDSIFKDQPHYVLMTTQFSVVADYLQAAVAKGVSVPVAALSFVNPDELAETYGTLARGTIVSQVVPSPRNPMNHSVTDCAAALKEFNGHALNYSSLEACIAAKTMVRVIQKIGPSKVTRSSLLKGMINAGKINIDGFPLDFSKGNKGSTYVDLTLLMRGNRFTN